MKIERTLAIVPLAAIELDDAEFVFGELSPEEQGPETPGLATAPYPPTLRRRGQRYQPVCGHARLRTQRERGVEEVEAFVLAPETTERQCVDYALAERLERPLDPVTRAAFLKRLQGLVSPAELLREYCPLLGLPQTAEAVERALACLRLIAPLRRMLAAGRLHQKAADLLALLDEADQEALAHLFEVCRLSQNLQRELAENLDDVARRDGKSIVELLQQQEAQSLLEDEELTPARRAAALRLMIHRWRFPAFSRREEEFAQAAARLAWPPALKISHHPTFENPRLQVQLTFQSREELLAVLTQLDKLRDERLLTELGLDA